MKFRVLQWMSLLSLIVYGILVLVDALAPLGGTPSLALVAVTVRLSTRYPAAGFPAT